MLTSLKEFVLPLLIYASVWIACGLALAGRPQRATYLYALLVPLPTLGYLIHPYPLGSVALSLLILSVVPLAWARRSDTARSSPNGAFLLFYILASYLYLWSTTVHFNLAAPVSDANPLFNLWKNFAAMILTYFLAYHALRTKESIRTLIFIYMLMLLLLSWREVSSFVTSGGFSYDRRANGPFWIVGLGANHFGAFIAHFSLVAVALFAVDRQRRRRMLYAAAFIASLYPLFFSYSRGAYAAVIAGLLVIGLVRYRPLLVLVAVLAFTWQSVLPDSVVDRIQMTETSDGQLEDSAAGRMAMWELAMRLFSDHPIFGIGFQGFSLASADMPLHNAHNYFYQTAAEEGVVGLALLAFLFLRAIASGWKLFRDSDDEFLRGVGLGLLVCTVAVIVTNIFGDRFSQIELGSYFFLLFGAADRAAQLHAPDPEPQAAARDAAGQAPLTAGAGP